MTRVDLCVREDYETLERVLAVITELGGSSDGDSDEPMLGIGLHRFQIGSEEITIFVDAWGADLAGPDRLVQQILAALSS